MASAWTRSDVTSSDGAVLAVHAQGPPDAPIVVLVHGYPDEHSVWDGVAARLAERFRVVAYDVRGAGASTAPSAPGAFRLEALVADLEAVLDAVAGARRVHLVGHDWGAMQTWEAVGEPRVAARIASFTAISGPCLDHVRAWVRAHKTMPHVILDQARRSWYIQLFQLPWLPELVWRTIGPKGWPWAMAHLEGAPFAGGPPPTMISDAIRGLALYRTNLRRHAPRRRTPRTVTVPTQILVATRDRYVSPRLYDGVERWVPSLVRHEVDGGHWIVRREPTRIADLLAAHIDRVGAAA